MSALIAEHTDAVKATTWQTILPRLPVAVLVFFGIRLAAVLVPATRRA